jgi:sulfite reductase (NADPH) flavoprotein alpha-component
MTSIPVRGTIIDRFCLSKPGALKEIWHLVIEIVGSHLPFSPGDSVGIWPRNATAAVQEALHYFHLTPTSPVALSESGSVLPASTYFAEKVDLNSVPASFVQLCAGAAFSEEDRRTLASLHASGETFQGYDIPQFVQTFVPHGTDFDLVRQGLLPIRPRLYSISSGPSQGRHRIELTVARVAYVYDGRPRHGICSHYLTQEAPLHIPALTLFHQPSRHFSFPSDPKIPLIMVGSGTGVAPFRSFMQEVEQGVVEPSACWLFFGGRKRKLDFLYEEFWNAHVQAGRLRLDLAFSQDQGHKIYVQHRMWEQRKDLWQWLCDGATLLVCGDAKTMAKDVDACVAKIVSEEGALHEGEALRFLRSLRHERRYLRDVY